jgi:hypothetical protein
MTHAQFAQLMSGARHGRFSEKLPAGPSAAVYSG